MHPRWFSSMDFGERLSYRGMGMVKGTNTRCRGRRLAALGSHCHPRAGGADQLVCPGPGDFWNVGLPVLHIGKIRMRWLPCGELERQEEEAEGLDDRVGGCRGGSPGREMPLVQKQGGSRKKYPPSFPLGSPAGVSPWPIHPEAREQGSSLPRSGRLGNGSGVGRRQREQTQCRDYGRYCMDSA